MATTYNLGQVAIVNKGAYSSAAQYAPLNTVKHRGGTFMCISACSNVEPGVTSGWATYWVATAIGIYSTNVTTSGSTATITFTFSDGTTASHQYQVATPPSVEYQVQLSGGASSWTVTKDINNNNLSDITSTSKLVVSVDPTSFTPGRNYGVRMDTYSNGTVNFVADSTVPAGTNIKMNILVVS